MKYSPRAVVAGIAVLVLSTQSGVAASAEIKVVSANAIRQVLEDLGPKFERASGHKLAISYGTAGAVVKRVQGGEAADVVINPRAGIDSLAKGGKVTAGSVSAIARTGIGVAVRKGAPKPDISTPEALKRTLLAAKSVATGDPARGGESAIHFAKVLDRLGIAKEMKTKTVFGKDAGGSMALVANGKAELAVNQLHSLASVPGLEIVGPLPGDLQHSIVFSAAIVSGTRDTAAAKALIAFLRAPDSAAVIKAKGMQPG